MDKSQLSNYLKGLANDYFEYSFYTNSSEIVDSIMKTSLFDVLQIMTVEETSKGVYKCSTNWKIATDKTVKKIVSIDITGEMIFITEIV